MEFIELIKVPKVDNVTMRRNALPTVEGGTLCITSHHLILSSRKDGEEELWLLHRNIDLVERKPLTLGGGSLVIKCKDFSVIHLDIVGSEDFNNAADSIEALSNVDAQHLMYAFFYRPMYSIVEDGWTAFSTEAEFSKLILQSENEWRISHINRDYSVCKSYPKTVVVPKSIPDEEILVAATFRQGGRFPVLCFRHENGAVLLRAGEPLVGPSGRRCKEDERLINAILTIGKRGYIIDTRSQTLAQTARTKGGGVELEIYYPQWRRIHKPIDRHYTLLDSLSKLLEACSDTNCTMDKWLSRLDASGWLTNVRETLNCACVVAQCLDQESNSVLIHGGDGVDLTLAVTSLTQIILNPDCRSIRGFEALIEREWLQGGYPFRTRHSKSAFAYSLSNVKNQRKAYAPSFLLFSQNGDVHADPSCGFLLFIDCVWQIYNQFPFSFEFSEQFLMTLVQHSYASQFGTFLCDNVCEREELHLMTKTVSLWSHVNRPDIMQSYMNPVYEPNPCVIWPSVHPISLQLWNGMYLKGIIDQSSMKKTWNTIAELKENEKELKKEAIKLRKYLLDLHQSRHSIQRKLSEATIDDNPTSDDCVNFQHTEDSSSESPGDIDHPLKYQ
ncbi:myotubularin-related protein 9 isoform X2 [Folsomia candida]|uniref:Myotubularin-related protein 9 n=1 Tax=Folsomia candida TaxID=158441 RepID=A0A226EGI2_FOLCA|nr:myotubularin-related protein 9 isoform X2 [Folsomia candida]OXA56682.1 Myotubularin-related protein 9 [Folsomia candida]